VFDQVKAEKKSPAWVNYQCYLNSIVIEGIAKAIITALVHMNEQISPSHIKKYDIPPLFDIKLELARGAGIAYDPEIEENTQGNTVRNTIRSWINDVFFIAGQFQRLDSSVQFGDYLPEIKDFFEIREVVSLINGNLDWIELETQKFKQNYDVYSDLWTVDPRDSFEEFLNENEPKDTGEDDEA
jgi:dynein heavy chain